MQLRPLAQSLQTPPACCGGPNAPTALAFPGGMLGAALRAGSSLLASQLPPSGPAISGWMPKAWAHPPEVNKWDQCSRAPWGERWRLVTGTLHCLWLIHQGKVREIYEWAPYASPTSASSYGAWIQDSAKCIKDEPQAYAHRKMQFNCLGGWRFQGTIRRSFHTHFFKL